MIYHRLLCALFISLPILSWGQGEPQEVRIEEDSLSSDELYQFNRHFFEGQRLKAVDRHSEALASFMACLEIDPDHPVVNFEIGQYYLENQEPTKAQAYLERAHELDPDNKWITRALWKLSEESFDLARAKEYLLLLTELEPSNGEYIWELSVIYIELNNADSAIFYLNRLEELFGFNDALMKQRYDIHMRAGDMQSAEAELQRASEFFPNRTDLQLQLASFYTYSNQNGKADSVYAEILRIDPQNAQAHVQVGGALARNNQLDSALYHIEKAMVSADLEAGYKLNILARFNDPAFSDFSERMLDTLLIIHPDDPVAFMTMAETYEANRQFPEAVEMYHKVLQTPTGDSWAVWERLLFLQSQLSDTDAFLQSAGGALDRYPLEPRAYLFMGEAHLRDGEVDDAMNAFEEGLMYANSPEMENQFKMELARAAFESGDATTAYMYFDDILHTYPDFHLALNNYAYYLALSNERLNDAEKYIARAVELNPSNPNYWDTFAWVLYTQGDDEKALEYINRALNSGGHMMPALHEHRGDILVELGRKSEAIESYLRAMELGGGRRIRNKINAVHQ